ncbi:hypothetical protein [Vallitalea guaymasensis]|uniref:Uncharacterized protein n=1 Tax=Vallitalea guaymasensis TaxID=1185412 RepID=A0A8J8MDZ0_9FIRM|nr:hypothetical protein [Vallitalea guaymasensis]QUH31128.1 hypothetical protein HYG85_20265 [Vallitalea guaymasensis]
MKNNRNKQITIVCALIVVAIVLIYGIFKLSQPTTQSDLDVNDKESEKVKVEDIDKETTITVPDIKTNEQKEVNDKETEKELQQRDNDKEKDIQEVNVEVEKPIVPPKPNLSKEEPINEPTESEMKPISSDEDGLKSGDEEENTKSPTYDIKPTVEEKPIENPVVITPDVPKDTSEDKDENVVPDSENPFLKSPSSIPSNGDRGERDSSNYGDGEWGTGDKF